LADAQAPAERDVRGFPTSECRAQLRVKRVEGNLQLQGLSCLWPPTALRDEKGEALQNSVGEHIDAAALLLGKTCAGVTRVAANEVPSAQLAWADRICAGCLSNLVSDHRWDGDELDRDLGGAP
jgi:hypothetical protein